MAEMRREVIEAAIASGLKVAFADGVLQAHEQERLLARMRHEIDGDIVSQGILTRILGEYLELYRTNRDAAHARAEKAMDMSFQPKEAEQIIRLCIAVGYSKKVMSYVERQACRQITERLGVKPEDYDL
ncbi:MAG TPA: hypothetical protein DHV03_06840 [Alphaproteobacteria bacterium]|nr:hypothetical protein [Paracoccaceae bacterium]RCL78012.1 MAG: hypothetical protein DBW67_07850 [SAR116 cluster bacterium]RPH14261.1 MAG: hypothetical protein CBD10_000060 [Alphaproteobacteria bacterium TMED150]HBQ23056.1 hypothetical protein [Alphaproteobacteria bacterium]HCJ61434.1 hypothetical protein [Alphaproteobacteria bacterium]|tara:strand:+ start:1805 stop:2191 length:387 start_codon:yes stop_codon:yes gene_type:complete